MGLLRGGRLGRSVVCCRTWLFCKKQRMEGCSCLILINKDIDRYLWFVSNLNFRSHRNQYFVHNLCPHFPPPSSSFFYVDNGQQNQQLSSSPHPTMVPHPNHPNYITRHSLLLGLCCLHHDSILRCINIWKRFGRRVSLGGVFELHLDVPGSSRYY